MSENFTKTSTKQRWYNSSRSSTLESFWSMPHTQIVPPLLRSVTNKIVLCWCTNNYMFQNLPVANSPGDHSNWILHSPCVLSPGLFLFIVLLFSFLEPLSRVTTYGKSVTSRWSRQNIYMFGFWWSLNQGRQTQQTKNMRDTNTKLDDSMNLS